MINEERIKVPAEFSLGTTIAYPDKGEKRPLVLLIAGTGSLDRDGNGSGLKLNLYKDLSDYFVEQGCVCVRYDKRGTHESKGRGAIASMSLTTLVDDAKAIIDYCKELPFVDKDRVIVCGHSEGSMVGTLLTEKMDLDGLILLSGAGTSLRDAMYYQNDRIISEAQNGKGFTNWLLRKMVNREKVNAQVEAVYDKANKTNKNMFFYRGSFLPTRYMQEHGALTGADFIGKIKAFKGKVLAITGTGDIQADYQALEGLKGIENVTVCAPEGINHILREVDDNNSMLTYMKQYKRLSKQPLSADTMGVIGAWLEENFSASKEM